MKDIKDIMNATIREHQEMERKRLKGIAALKPGDSFEFCGLVGTTVKYPGYRGIMEALKTKLLKFGKVGNG